MDRDSDAKSEIQSEFTIRQDLGGLYLCVESDQIWTEFQYDSVFPENYFLLERLVNSRRAKSVMIWLRKSSTYIDFFSFAHPRADLLNCARSEIILCGAGGSADFGHVTQRNNFTWRQEVSEGLARFGLDHVTQQNHFMWRNRSSEITWPANSLYIVANTPAKLIHFLTLFVLFLTILGLSS